MKILRLVEHYLPFLGGVEINSHEIDKRLVRDGFDVEVICERVKGTAKYEVMDGVKVHRVSGFRLIKLRYDVGRVTPAMLLSAVRNDADVVHAHAYGYFPTWASIFSNKPTVITPHSDPVAKIYPLWDLFRAVPIRKADKIVALSEMEKKRLIKLGVKAEKIVIINNGVTLPPVKGKDIGVHPMILSMARMDIDHKGQDVMLKAMKNACETLPDVKLVMAGDGKDFSKVRSMAKTLGLNNCVEFIGPLFGAPKWNYLSSCDVLSIAPRTEGFPITYLEAMAYGKPIVTTNVGGIPEVVGDCAILVPPNDPDSLADALIQVLTDRRLAEGLSKRGLERVKMFDWDVLVKKYEELYEELA